MAIHTISMCSGYAGLELGLEIALPGIFRPVLYCEYEVAAVANMVKNMQSQALHPAAIWSNVKTITSPQCRSYIRTAVRGGKLAITGGYPCQPFSNAGKRGGTSDPRHLWPYIAKAIEVYQPELCFFENVAGHLTLGFDVVGRELRDLGYNVAAGLFEAKEVGARHKRERLFILAYNDRWRCGKRPDETESQTLRRGDAREFESCNSVLADSTRQRYKYRSRERYLPTKRKESPEFCLHSGGRSEILGDTGERRLSGYESQPQKHVQDVEQGCDGLPVFPPGPGEIELWGKIIATDPTLEPAIYRMADGNSYRVERLRMLGNGVVPLQAAYAFVSLASVLMFDDELISGQ